MSIKISQLNSEKRTVEVKFGQETLNVTYRPNCVTPQFLDDLQQPKQGEAIAQAIEKIVVEWDLLNEQGKKLPPKIALVKTLPIGFLMTIMEAVRADTEIPKAALETLEGG